MTPIADMVRRMLEKGVGHEAILIAIEGAEEALQASTVSRLSRDERVTNRRETDRLRQQRYRDSHDSLRDERDKRDVPLSKSNLKKEEREAESVTSRDNWRPCEEDWNAAVEKLGLQAAESELTKFRERRRKLPLAELPSEWRVWVQLAVDYLRDNPKNKPAPPAPTKMDAAFDWDAVIRTYHKTGYWSPQAGPDPESPACRCPREILEKHTALAMKATG